MKVTHIRLTNFRNHRHTEADFGSGINALLGNNGQGKTNVLEAVSYLSLTKSFYAANDATTLQLGQDRFDIEGTIVADAGTSNTVRVVYTASSGEKDVLVNGSRPDTLYSVIGRFPVVIVSPENGAITSGPPAERRKFLDLVLSQLGRAYLDDLIEYRKVLRHRNRILLDAKLQNNFRSELLDPWSESLILYGSRIVRRRMEFMERFRPYVEDAYHRIGGVSETPGLSYVASHAQPSAGTTPTLEEQLGNEIGKRALEEVRRGTTLVGPHRDEISLTLGGVNVQKYASQGQHRTLLVALKVAEFFYLKEHRGEAPIFLLDDVFGELDEHRSKRILEVVETLGQTVITATNEAPFRDAIHWDGYHRRFHVENGTCRPC